MTVANVGWDLQAYSDGRFILGLGSQIKPHIEKRFSMPWSQPVQRMREFVLAMREIWSCWQDGTKLAFEGDFYTHKLMTPMFTPEPHAHGFPKVFVAAVGEAMTEMCGEVADGLLAHAFTTKRYFEEVTTPALLRGMERSGRQAQRIPAVLSAVRGDGQRRSRTGRQRRRHTQADRLLRARRPPTARFSNCTAGATCRPNCTGCRMEGEWDEMGSLIDDEILDDVRGRRTVRRRSRGKIRDRCDGVIDRVLVGFPSSVDEATVTAVLQS